MSDKNKKITPEESHKLATAPLPIFNIFMPQLLGAGNRIGSKKLLNPELLVIGGQVNADQ